METQTLKPKKYRNFKSYKIKNVYKFKIQGNILQLI